MNNKVKIGLDSLIEKADASMIEPACIQNGHSGDAFAASYKEQTKGKIASVIDDTK